MDNVKTAPIKSFSSTQKWHAWLAKNHASPQGIWLKIYKKDSNKKTVTYAEALDEALCFGWIDGLKKTYDDESWVQKFTPRRARSMWSKRNREHVARLIKEKRMQPEGMKEVEKAKKEGRWEHAYDSPSNMQIPEDFLKELKKHKKAYEFFKTLNRVNLYAIGWRLQTAKKPETREKRMKVLLEMMKDNKKIH
ncbi:MAG: YdeI/OmpD-associated family protein [Leptospira sp.]|nr:YdeI/OmpD-associated family protein [Leptospira sp.]